MTILAKIIATVKDAGIELDSSVMSTAPKIFELLVTSLLITVDNYIITFNKGVREEQQSRQYEYHIAVIVGETIKDICTENRVLHGEIQTSVRLEKN